MKYMLASWFLSAAAFMVASYLLPGFTVDGPMAALIAAAALGACNALVRPFIILFTLPVTVLTLGLFLLVVNGAVLALAIWFVPGVHVANIGWAIAAALIISAINAVLGSLLG